MRVSLPEAIVAGDAPSRATDPVEAERYWAEKNASRWAEAVQMEAEGGKGFCDTDPLKLHYVWII